MRIRSAVWFAVAVVIAVTALTTLFNQTRRAVDGRALTIGQPLIDDPPPGPPPSFGWQRLASHDYQADVQGYLTRSVPVRPMLVRLHNQTIFSVVRASPLRGIVIGRDGNLVEHSYVESYCNRSLAESVPVMRQRTEQLRALQDHFEKRNRAFLYVITPSKMARMSDTFLEGRDCPVPARERDAIISTYVEMLGQAGVHVVDAASLMTELRKQGMNPFPIGGIHWNMFGAAYGANAIIRRLNETAKRPLLPELRWSAQPSDGPLFEDADLVVGLELLHQPSYPSVAVSFDDPGPCPSGQVSMLVVGASFSIQLVRALGKTGCISRGRHLQNLIYALREFPGPPKITPGPLQLDAIRPLLDADVVIAEENERVPGASRHVTAFFELMMGREPVLLPSEDEP